MTKESEIDKEVLDETYRRGYDYCARMGCAPGVFAAVMEALGYEDDPVVNGVWKAALGLIGGTGNMSIGTCGAMAGAAMAISYSFGFTKEDLDDQMKMLKVSSVVAEVGKKMQEKYGHIQCQEVQFHHWGKSYRFTNPKVMQEFARARIMDCLPRSSRRPCQMDREEDFGAQPTFLQTKTKMRQNLIPSNFRCARHHPPFLCS